MAFYDVDLQGSGADRPHEDPRRRGRDEILPPEIAAAIAALQARSPTPLDGAQDVAAVDPRVAGRVLGLREKDALEVLYRRYAGVVTEAAATVLDSRADVDDTVQDVFGSLPTTIGRYRPGNFASWLRTVAINAARMRRRTQQRRREDGFADNPPPRGASDGTGPDATTAPVDITGAQVGETDVTDAEFDLLDDVEAVARALAALSPGLRAVVVLRAAHDLPHDVIAARLGISVQASWVRYHRALKRLRDLLRREGPGTSLCE